MHDSTNCDSTNQQIRQNSLALSIPYRTIFKLTLVGVQTAPYKTFTRMLTHSSEEHIVSVTTRWVLQEYTQTQKCRVAVTTLMAVEDAHVALDDTQQGSYLLGPPTASFQVPSTDRVFKETSNGGASSPNATL